MSKRHRTALIKYGCCAAFTAVLVAVYFLLRQDLDTASLTDWYRMLCDAFSIPGILLLCVGALVAVANEGALDGLSYVVSYAARRLIPGKFGPVERYYDYVQRKRANKTRGYGFLLISGAVVMAVALVFMALFYWNYSG